MYTENSICTERIGFLRLSIAVRKIAMKNTQVLKNTQSGFLKIKYTAQL